MSGFLRKCFLALQCLYLTETSTAHHEAEPAFFRRRLLSQKYKRNLLFFQNLLGDIDRFPFPRSQP